MSDTAGRSLSSHDHLFSAVTVWCVAFPFAPATAGRVEVANMAGSERRAGMRLAAAHSMQLQQGRMKQALVHVQKVSSIDLECRVFEVGCSGASDWRKSRPLLAGPSASSLPRDELIIGIYALALSSPTKTSPPRRAHARQHCRLDAQRRRLTRHVRHMSVFSHGAGHHRPM